jgi:hypothetical protein
VIPFPTSCKAGEKIMAKNQPQNNAVSDVYTAVLALATLSVIATSVYVAMKCMQEYGTIFAIFN